MQDYLLAPHVYLCATEDGVVFLDLKRDKYLGLSVSAAHALESVVVGWPFHGSHPEARPGDTRIAPGLASRLLSSGLLTRDPHKGKSATPPPYCAPAEILPDRDMVRRPPLNRQDIWRFVSASLTARLLLSACPLQWVVRRVEHRKAAAARRASCDAARSTELACIFRHLRPFLFTAYLACVFDSLALVEFLARYGSYPDWMFGVRTRPFAAHSWVQHGNVVLNGTLEYVRAFKPILIV